MGKKKQNKKNQKKSQISKVERLIYRQLSDLHIICQGSRLILSKRANSSKDFLLERYHCGFHSEITGEKCLFNARVFCRKNCSERTLEILHPHTPDCPNNFQTETLEENEEDFISETSEIELNSESDDEIYVSIDETKCHFYPHEEDAQIPIDSAENFKEHQRKETKETMSLELQSSGGNISTENKTFDLDNSPKDSE
ncbi:MAG: hypothetical protein MJ252_11720 [archaeon]|nr:hypothetical protein [archaeon]